jgi:four helix bundle protein
MDLIEMIFEAGASFPKSEVYGLTSQIKRAAVSVASNVSEGCGMATDKGFVNYLHNALGSAKEVKCQLMIAVRLGFLDKERGDELIDISDRVIGMLMRFIKHVSNERSENEV